MIKDVEKQLNAKNFNYKKSLEAYYANSKGSVKIFPKNPTENDVSRLKLEMQNLIDSNSNPADIMDYHELIATAVKFELDLVSRKKADVYAAVKTYYDEK